jgi:hypothetical protein
MAHKSEREVERQARARFDAAHGRIEAALTEARLAWGVWVDCVAQRREREVGVVATGGDVLDDPEYRAALDEGHSILAAERAWGETPG